VNPTIKLVLLYADSLDKLHAGLPDFFGTTYQNGKNMPNGQQNIPNRYEIQQVAAKIPNALKYTSIFLSKVH
jgi:hypothetical protein